MSNISEIDKNLKIETEIHRDGLVFFNSKSEPFRVNGLIYDEDTGSFVRMPKGVAKTVSPSVLRLSSYTAGGRVRFITDSPYVAIKTVQPRDEAFGHMAPSGQTGFDMYSGNEYIKTFVPPALNTGYESVIDLPDASERTITIDFPLYYNVDELYIGLKKGSVLKKAPDYTVKKPIVYYGSSITQGGCASRAGTSYQGFISRALDADYINLGFSGSACGEREMADYIAGLQMSAFVLDYDHNAPTNAHLEATHEPFFKTIREAHPTLPIIIMPRPKIKLSDMEKKRRSIIMKTYENAKAAGDENVYFIDGCELMALAGDEGTVDGTHPTDLGFFSMAKRMIEVLSKII